jgi:hypothetical protein
MLVSNTHNLWSSNKKKKKKKKRSRSNDDKQMNSTKSSRSSRKKKKVVYEEVDDEEEDDDDEPFALSSHTHRKTNKSKTLTKTEAESLAIELLDGCLKPLNQPDETNWLDIVPTLDSIFEELEPSVQDELVHQLCIHLVIDVDYDKKYCCWSVSSLTLTTTENVSTKTFHVLRSSFYH